jgi:hypothetical protein
MKVALSTVLATLVAAFAALPAAAANYGPVTLSVPITVNNLPGAVLPVTCVMTPPPNAPDYGTTLTFTFNPTSYGTPYFLSGTYFSCLIGSPNGPPAGVDPSQSTLGDGPITLK